jgi:putative hemolysin
MVTLAWILGLALTTSFLCSILEAVFLSVSHSYTALLQEEEHPIGEWLAHAQKNIDEPIAAILTLNTIAHSMGAAMGGAVAARVFGEVWVTAFSAALTLVVLLFSEIVPKTLGATFWKQLLVPSVHILKVMIVVMKPVLIPLGWISRMLTPEGDQPTVSRAELAVLAEIGRREGALDEDEWRVVSSVIRLDEVSIGEVMTPRTDIAAISSASSIQQARDMMLEMGHMRLPVYEDNLDHVIGVVIGRDVWKADRDGITDLEVVMRPLPFAPASKPVEDLIPEMRQQRTKMAIVLDEFGGTAGLVTLEDLIEEIVGEIQDEHEGDEPIDFQLLAAGRLRVWGGASLRDTAERLDFAPGEDEDFDTVGGLVFGRLNRIPSVGDEIDIGPGRLRVTRMRGRRIEYLLYLPNGQHGQAVD